jgi:tetratricopeptide (TPR) repeat protein
MGNPEKAINLYKSNFRALPTDYSSYQGLATLYLDTGHYARVIECYQVLQGLIGPGICDDPPRRLAVYMNGRILDFECTVPIDESFREHLLWYPISEAHKGKGDHHQADKIYEAMIDEYHEEDRCFRFVVFPTNQTGRPTDGRYCDWGLAEVPKDVLLCALGEVYKAKKAVKPALETFQKVQKLFPSNSYLKDVIAELEEQLLQKSFGRGQVS